MRDTERGPSAQRVAAARAVRVAQALYRVHQGAINARFDAEQLTDLLGNPAMPPKVRAEFMLDWDGLDNDTRYVYCDMAVAALEAMARPEDVV